MRALFKITALFIFAFFGLLYGESGNKKVYLTGKINNTTPKYITPKQLDKLFSSLKFNTFNPWEKQKDYYEGIFLNEFIKKYGKKDVKEVKIKALDDYEITFSKELYENERILLSYKVNGKYISIREKGPMRIVFVDYDASKKKYELNLPKWLWMIRSIEFK